MTRRNQKSEELRRVEQLQRALGGVPEGQMHAAEEPDVILTTAGRRIGIEVTELHQISKSGQPPRRLQESERAGILARARRLAEEAAIPPLDVAVHFNESVPIAKRDRELIANNLVTLVSAHIPTADEESLEVDEWRHQSQLPWIRTVRIFRAHFLTRHHWAAPDSGWVQMDFVAELQAAIDQKNARHGRYVGQCDECWLLIVASGGRPSGLFEPSVETRHHVYESHFARTFFLEAFSGKLLELVTSPH